MSTIHTNLYSDKANQILNKLLDYLGNGSWGSSRMERAISYLKIKRSFDNEILIECDDARYWRKSIFVGHSQDEIVNKLAIYMKASVQKAFSRDHIDMSSVWKRASHETVRIFSTDDNCVKISEVYFIYDFLRNRKKLENKYTKSFIDKLVGEQLDPIRAEMEKTRQEELAKAKVEFDKIREENNIDHWSSAAYKEYQEARSKLFTEFRSKYQKIIDEAKAKYEAKVAEINQMADMMNAMA